MVVNGRDAAVSSSRGVGQQLSFEAPRRGHDARSDVTGEGPDLLPLKFRIVLAAPVVEGDQCSRNG